MDVCKHGVGPKVACDTETGLLVFSHGQRIPPLTSPEAVESPLGRGLTGPHLRAAHSGGTSPIAARNRKFPPPMPTQDFATLPIPTGEQKPRTNPTRRKLTNEQAAALQLEYRKPGVTSAYLGEKYGISQQSAYRIATGQRYAELPTAPLGSKLNWVDPPVRRRGQPSDVELKRLINALKSNIGSWALIKKTVRRPQVDYWQAHGVEAESRKLPTGNWGVYVRWPADSEALLAS